LVSLPLELAALAALVRLCSLKLQRDKLRQYQRRIEGILVAEQEAARQALAAGNKQRALLALRRRKYQDSLLVQTDQQLATLQELVQSIEFARIEKDVLYGLKQGTSVLKELNSEMRIEDVERLMGESAEAIAYQQVGSCASLSRTLYRHTDAVTYRTQEVDEMLQSRMSAEDEEAVQAELQAMEAEQVRLDILHDIYRTRSYFHALQTLLRAPQLPDAPTKVPTMPEGLDDAGE
jgi:charged multivesicular body protein 6